MKKLIAFILTVVMILGLTACAGAPASSTGSSSGQSALTSLEQAKKACDEKKWDVALEKIKDISAVDPDYEAAQKLLPTATEGFVSQTLATINEYKAEKNYIDAIQVLNVAISKVRDDRITNELNAMQELLLEKLNTEAKKLYDEGNSQAAMALFDDAFNILKDPTVSRAKEQFIQDVSVYLMKDLMPENPAVNIEAVTNKEGVQNTYGEEMAFGLTSVAKEEVVFRLGGEYRTIRGTLFIPVESQKGTGKASFAILADSVTVFSRSGVNAGFKTVEFEANVQGKDKLTLRFVGAGTAETPAMPWVADVCVMK